VGPATRSVRQRDSPIRLPTVSGGEVDLEDFSGRPIVLVFWDPVCSFCRALGPDLRAREAASVQAAAQVAFVSRGTRAAIEAERFASPVLLDPEGVLARAYGALGTPQAILIDAEGRIASPLATGAGSLFLLLEKADLVARAARILQA
jgi:peroxiredoxin